MLQLKVCLSVDAQCHIYVIVQILSQIQSVCLVASVASVQNVTNIHIHRSETLQWPERQLYSVSAVSLNRLPMDGGCAWIMNAPSSVVLLSTNCCIFVKLSLFYCSIFLKKGFT